MNSQSESQNPVRKSRPVFVWLAMSVAAMLLLPLLVGIWFPDVLFPVHHTLAQRRLVSGHAFHVYQYWNRGDFYNTELLVTYPDGHNEWHVLDPDSTKSWFASIEVNESIREVRVSRYKTVKW
ncbi:MAG TPA: hypothetical protein VK968_17010 [Roseimicrobium sp.]|nr:hypothetical protein [Roseimicrobium sp.]